MQPAVKVQSNVHSEKTLVPLCVTFSHAGDQPDRAKSKSSPGATCGRSRRNRKSSITSATERYVEMACV